MERQEKIGNEEEPETWQLKGSPLFEMIKFKFLPVLKWIESL